MPDRRTTNFQETASGRFRTSEERIHVVDDDDRETLHVPPPADSLPTRVDALCGFANGTSDRPFIHPVIRSIILHFWIGYARKRREVRDVEKLMRDRDDLNHRQVAVIGHALRHPDERYTIHSHQRSHGVVYQTARADLLKLVDMGFLVARKSQRAFAFYPAPDLEKKLKASGSRG